MSVPESFTPQQASDPQTPGEVLAEIAAKRPDLRPAVAANPSTYPSLVDWLRTLHDPAVDAALASRPAGAQPTAVLPTAPPVPQWSPGPQAPAPGYPAPGYPAPGYPAPGQPGMAYAGAPAPKKGSKTALWVVLGIVGGLVVLGVAGFFIIRALFGGVNGYGDDPHLDALYNSCAAEDWQACDDLFNESPNDSDYETFGDTCGNRTDGGTYCVEEFGDPSSYGDDADLDALWDSCVAEDWQACDDLFNASPTDSEYETFGDTCGNRTDGGTYCIEEFGDPSSYGDDADLDALWDSCVAEDWQACDDLFNASPTDSEYETFGDTCGNRTDGGTYCIEAFGEPFTYGDDAALDALWNACAGGDGQACDDLYQTSPANSEYETFGDTCGNRTDGGTFCAP